MAPTSAATGAGATAVAPALARCVSTNRETFAAQYWSQQPLLTPADALPGGFTDLLSPGDIDALVAERGLRQPFFRMVREGAILAGPTRYATAGSRRISDLIDGDRARDRYAAGATLVLQSLHRIHPPVVKFCRQLAADLGHATQANAYITPPGNRGFDPHHDTHDVFVLQIDGRKLWHIFAPALALPLSTQPSADVAKSTPLVPEGAEPVLSVELGPGDALYLPRGYVHSAETNDERSIHLTVGVLTTTHYDVLRDVLALAAEDPQFRQSLPLGAALDRENLRATVLPDLLRRAGAWLSALDPDDAMARLTSRLDGAVPIEPLGLLASTDGLATLSKETVVRARSGLPMAVSAGGDGTVSIGLRDRMITLPEFVQPSLRRLLAGPALAVADLADGSAGSLDADDALVLVRRLLREGIVVTGG